MKAVAIFADGTVRVVDWQPEGDRMDVYIDDRGYPRRFFPHFAQSNHRGVPTAEVSVCVWVEQADPERR